MRWEEEHILLNYKMQWTIRFFKKRSEKWNIASDYPDISSGAKAYALHQESRWKGMSIKSDIIFKNTSPDYIMPFIFMLVYSVIPLSTSQWWNLFPIMQDLISKLYRISYIMLGQDSD